MTHDYLTVGLGQSEDLLQLVADIAADQQGDERADLGVVEPGSHPDQARVNLLRVEQVSELQMNLTDHILQVGIDLEGTWIGVRRCQTGHVYNVVSAVATREAAFEVEAQLCGASQSGDLDMPAAGVVTRVEAPHLVVYSARAAVPR